MGEHCIYAINNISGCHLVKFAILSYKTGKKYFIEFEKLGCIYDFIFKIIFYILIHTLIFLLGLLQRNIHLSYKL